MVCMVVGTMDPDADLNLQLSFVALEETTPEATGTRLELTEAALEMTGAELEITELDTAAAALVDRTPDEEAVTLALPEAIAIAEEVTTGAALELAPAALLVCPPLDPPDQSVGPGIVYVRLVV